MVIHVSILCPWSYISGLVCHLTLTINLTGVGGKITPQANLFAAILEPHAVDRYPLLTFPRYVWAMGWQNPGMFIIIQNSNMAAAKPAIVKFFQTKNNIKGVVSLLTDEISMKFQRRYQDFESNLSLG